MTFQDEAVKAIDPAQQQEVSGRLKAIMSDCKTTQTEFAANIGYKPAYINHISNGAKPISGAFFYNFAKHYGTVYDIHWLLTGIGAMKIGDTPAQLPEKEVNVSDRIALLEEQMETVIAKINQQ